MSKMAPLRALVVSSFSAALASVSMAAAFDSGPGGYGGTSLGNMVFRAVCFVLGVSSNVIMWQFFLSANVSADSATEVSALALGLNFLFSALLSRGIPRAYQIGRELLITTMSLLSQPQGTAGAHGGPAMVVSRLLVSVSESVTELYKAVLSCLAAEKKEEASMLTLDIEQYKRNFRFLVGVGLILVGVRLLSSSEKSSTSKMTVTRRKSTIRSAGKARGPNSDNTKTQGIGIKPENRKKSRATTPKAKLKKV